MLRKCTQCGVEAHTVGELNNFALNKPSRFGRQNTCNSCMNKMKLNYKQNHRDIIRVKNKAYMKGYYAEHSEARRQYARNYRVQNPEKKRAQNRVRRESRESNCILCDSTSNLERHHPDYNEPDVFITLCAPCHRQLHFGGGGE